MQAHTVRKLQITENLTKSQSQHISRILLAGWDVMYEFDAKEPLVV